MIYEFTPTQDLHGYDKPWPAGGGKNKLLISSTYDTGFAPTVIRTYTDDTITISGTSSSSNTQIYSQDISSIIASLGTATVSMSEIQALTNCSYRINVHNGSTVISRDSLSTPRTYTNTEGYTYLLLGYISTSGAVSGKVAFQIESGSTATSFAPYSNICPLEGYNIWDPNNQEYVQVYSGYVNSNTRELYLRPVYQEYAGEELVGPWMSSLDPYEEDTTPTEGAFVIDFGGEMTSYEITPFMLQTLLESLGIRQHFTNGARLLNSLMDQAQGRVRSEVELLHLSRPLNVIAIGDQLPAGITFKPIFKDVLPGLPGKFIR